MEVGLGFWTRVGVGFWYGVEGRGSRLAFKVGFRDGVGFRDASRGRLWGLGMVFGMEVGVGIRDKGRGQCNAKLNIILYNNNTIQCI